MRLARFATALRRKASASSSNVSSRPGSRYAALTSGIEAYAACCTDARTKASRAPGLSISPWCQAASSPHECAKVPVGKAESTTCQASQSDIADSLASEEKVSLRERQHVRRRGAKLLAIGRHDIRFRID